MSAGRSVRFSMAETVVVLVRLRSSMGAVDVLRSSDFVFAEAFLGALGRTVVGGRSMPARRLSTLGQVSLACCRTKRTLAYQGLSSPLAIQRQLGIIGSTAQVGVPTAPAKWTVALPTETTMSSAAIFAAKLSRSTSGSPSSES